jgi:hypothetical protein
MLWNTILLAFRAIQRNFVRSFLTVLGVVIGVAAVVTMVTLGNGATRSISDQIASLGSNLLMVMPGKRLGPASDTREAQALKGIERTVQLYRVIQPSGVRGRLEAAAAAHGLTPFVGREDELRLLMNRWEQALDSEGQVALIVGEAGIGKSRLVQHFHEQIAGMPHTWVEAAAGAFFPKHAFLRGY